MIALLILLAADPPPSPGIGRTFPDESVVLPTNARPVAFLSVADGPAIDIVSGVDVLDVDEVEGALVVNPGPLAPGGRLIFAARCDGCDFRLFTWDVGDVDDVTPPGFAPGGVTNESVLGFHTGGLITFPAGYEVALDLPAIDELALVRLDGGAESFFPNTCCAAAGEATRVSFVIRGGDERTECFDAVAVDVAGNETLFAEPLCFELTHDLLDEPTTCATGASAAPLVVTLALLARRRRSR